MPEPDFLSRLLQGLAKCRLHTQQTANSPEAKLRPLVVAVSGGADSVALLLGLRALAPELGRRLVVAHFNHGWRGAESDADAQWVEQLAGKLGCDFRGGHLAGTEWANQPKSEEVARTARYHFLASVAMKAGARCILTGHTANDQAETVLFQLLRGSGLSGLRGMPHRRRIHSEFSALHEVWVLRPMLHVLRGAVEDYLLHRNQPFRVDSSNADPHFSRNRIRHLTLPRLQNDFGPEVIHSLLRLSRQASETHGFLTRQARVALDRAVIDHLPKTAGTPANQVVELRADILAECDVVVRREVFVLIWKRCAWPRRRMTAAHWQSLANLVISPSDRAPRQASLPDGYTAAWRRDVVTLQPPNRSAR